MEEINQYNLMHVYKRKQASATNTSKYCNYNIFVIITKRAMVVFTGLVVDKDLAPAGLDSLHLFPALQSSH
jgi:hypothetical protein